eukprot:GHVU01044756.1.p2 GENE.GHVU01044756.1~~GHVU01044756.1.p2  ORF type:complete len:483 (+),score=75.41 GHVU01044756.1:1960-3408(+)
MSFPSFLFGSQVVHDAIDAGVPKGAIVRLGGSPKADKTLEDISFRNLKRTGGSGTADRHAAGQLHGEISMLEPQDEDPARAVMTTWVNNWRDSKSLVAASDPYAVEAFTVPWSPEGWSAVGRGGKKNRPLSSGELWKNWIRGDPLPLSAGVSDSRGLWTMPKTQRQKQLKVWRVRRIVEVANRIQRYNQLVKCLRILYAAADREVLGNRRIIACTTTSAAKNAEAFQGVQIDVVMLEEAGEILEAHVLASLTETVKSLIMLGDHKQLRPKIENFALSAQHPVNPFALNVSLFERQVLGGAAFETLLQQHRMRAEIAAFPRTLTYPTLSDAPGVSSRRALEGVPSNSNVVFVDHAMEEGEDEKGRRQMEDGGLSKVNRHEVQWVCAIVKYLLRSYNYNAEDIVVLTPYLGQLVLLRHALGARLGDRDARELVEAGLEEDGGGKDDLRAIRVATVDNFQGGWVTLCGSVGQWALVGTHARTPCR